MVVDVLVVFWWASPFFISWFVLGSFLVKFGEEEGKSLFYPSPKSQGGKRGGNTRSDHPNGQTSPEYPVDRIPGATAIASEVTPAMIETIREDYHIPQSVTLIAPEPQWRACSPPVGYGTLYIKNL